MEHEHDFQYESKTTTTGHFDEIQDSLYFLKLVCSCGEESYEQYNYEGQISKEEFEGLTNA